MLCNFPKATESARGTARTKTCRCTNFWAKELLFFSLFKDAFTLCSDIFE